MKWLALFLRWLQVRFCCHIPRRYRHRRDAFPHPIGIVIGDGVTLGQDVRIYQHVTLGLRQPGQGTNDRQYPVIGDRVLIYAGAVIAGGVRVGDDAIIGANVVVTHDVPAGSVVTRQQSGQDVRDTWPRSRPNARKGG